MHIETKIRPPTSDLVSVNLLLKSWNVVMAFMHVSERSPDPRPGQDHGTGSYPLVPKGRHRPSLFAANQEPLGRPCLVIASWAYSEHVGRCLHRAGK